MAIRKLGNPKFKNQGSQAREAVDDQNTHILLKAILMELKTLNLHLQSITDLEIEHNDKLEDYNK